MTPKKDIDILENTLRKQGILLDILLLRYPSEPIIVLIKKKHKAKLSAQEMGNITRHNIIWATDSYLNQGLQFAPKKPLKAELVTGIYGKLIQPRAAKPLEEQRRRTREKAEVFTPLNIVSQMNKQVDWALGYPPKKDNWQDYIKQLRLEITCGEAPFIVSRYDPMAHSGTKHILYNSNGKLNRVGFLDRKLDIVNQHCNNHKDWVYWAKEAYKSSYGYEWQGDNLLIARENLLYTFIDFYKHKFGKNPSIKLQEEIAIIISWNIFQMDGLKYVVPMSCKHVNRVIPGELTLFGETPDKVEKDECEGCKLNRPDKHNGKYVKIMDWQKNKPIRFADMLLNINHNMTA